MKKLLAGLLCAALMVTPFTACGSKSTASSAAGSTAESKSTAPVEATTIKVSIWDNASSPHFDNIIKAFEEANPNIKVELIDIPGTDYNNKLNIMLNGGSELDVFGVKDASMLKDLFNKGQAEDIMPLVTRDSVDLGVYNGVTDGFTFDGKLAALPNGVDYYVMYYNKDIFDAANEPYPSNDMTWTEFEETAKRLTSGEGSTKKYGALLHTWQACVQNWAVQDGKHSIMDTDYSFFKPYYEMALRMQNDDKTIPDYGTLKTGNIHYSSPFLKGDIAMMPMGSWFMSSIITKKAAGESDINWGVATLPHGEGVPAGSVVGANSPMCMNSASKNKDAAWEFIKFACGIEGVKLNAAVGKMPAIVTDETLGILTSLEGMPEGLNEALKYTNFVLDRPIADKVSDIDKMLGEEHSLIMLGEASIDDGLAHMSERSVEIQSN